jgi:ribokinase
MIYVVGSINLDYIAVVDRLPRPGETVVGVALTTSPGGKGANQALAARRAGAEVAMVAAVGSDNAAEQATRFLARDGVDLKSHLFHFAGNTGSAIIHVDRSGENSISIFAGANSALKVADIEKSLAALAADDILLLQLEVPAAIVARALELAHDAGATSILNIAPVLPETRRLVEMADIVVANETEFAETFDAPADDFIDAATRWTTRSGRTLVVTLGAKGAVLVDGADGRKVLEVKPPRVNVVDTVGAGDTFCGYFAAGLAKGMSKDDALRHAVVASALTCQQHGAQAPMPYESDVWAFRDANP